MPLWIRWMIVVVVLILAGAVVRQECGDSIAKGFEVTMIPKPSKDSAPFFQEEIINKDQNLPFIHVCSLVELAGDKLGALWYGGPYEYCHDNCIYFSTQKKGIWTAPRAIMTPEKIERDLGRPIRCLGNPLLLVNRDGSLRLIFVTIAMGRWSGSQINTSLSKDGGVSWSRVERLTLSPLCNFSELVRNRPIPLVPVSPMTVKSGDSWCVPLYQELIGKFPELLWLKEIDDRVVAQKSRMAGGCATLQPSLLPLDKETAVALLRDWTQAKRIFMSRTKDGGITWTDPVATSLPNPDAGISGLRLSDGNLIVAYNDSVILREKLSLAFSDDSGASWKNIFQLEHDPDACSSYPFLMRTTDGMIRMVYTHEGDNIKMLTINESWITAQLAGMGRPIR